MVSDLELLRLSRFLVELRDSVEYLPAAASELHRLFPCDEVVWMDIDFPAGRFAVWRASLNARDRETERALPHLLHHPAIETYMRDPVNLTPRRDADVTDLAQPVHLDALHLSQELLGRHQLSIVTHVDPIGLGRGWIITRARRQFDDDHLDVASRLLPILLLLDRLHRPTTGAPLSSQSSHSPGWGDLSIRERQVVDLLATGLTAPAIGRVLGISARTVGKHLEHVYRKLGRHDRLLVAQCVSWRREMSPA